MTYLIAHIVRGQPAFDIAIQHPCPVCAAQGCDECDDGVWWIIPTSGHRAYPYWSIPLGALGHDDENAELIRTVEAVPLPPPNWPDHYACNNRTRPATDILAAIGLAPVRPTIRRRI